MLTEEILYKNSRTGTTAFYFVPNITPAQVPELQEPAYVVFNNYNMPIFYATYSGKEIWKLEDVNNYTINVQLSALTNNYITGYSVSQTFNTPIPNNQRTIIEQKFNSNITSTITAQTQISINYPTYVFFKEHEIDDMFANIKLSRSYETLDTLSIYNKPINSIPIQEAKTGILFGKLEAIQTLKDEVGNNFRIPLKNVPIGIFNKSDEFPSPVSLDDNGDRFFMNLKETATSGQYFDSIAFNEDQKFLKTASQFVSMPDKFKFVTITNDNGEFVIYDVPVGSQTVVFEVDLFKQGLTKDEIILNNFPFPTSDEASIGEFPSYYFNQIPVDVVPAWGTSQTGYTELDISVNLDLRKWATYIFPPAAYAENERLEATVAQNSNNTFKIQVKDMTNKQFAAKTLEVTQIPKDLDRSSGSKYLWYNELLQQRQQLEFFEFGCQVIKLPANLYDPNGFRTDSGGTPTTQKGVWLAAYQLKCFVDKTICSRATGGYKDASTTDFWSHFDINFITNATDTADISGLGIFPYEKPWTINYPEPYHIPPMPVKKRFDYDVDRTYGNLPSNTIQLPYFVIEEPAYEDGDLVGNIVGSLGEEVAGGFGVQNKNGTWFPNQIAYVATKDYMYKYERDVRWNETYANGYEPIWTQLDIGPYIAPHTQLAGMSNVRNGEKYQRVECGYGYFMKYIDWPRVYRAKWSGDIYFEPDDKSVPGISAPGISNLAPLFNSLRSWVHNCYNINDQNFAFAFNQRLNNKPNNNSIDIYRIVESGIDDIRIPTNFTIATYVGLACAQTIRGDSDINNGYPAWKLINNGQFKVTVNFVFVAGYTINYNDGNGGGTVNYVNGTSVDLYPGGFFSSPANQSIAYTLINLPGNSNYDSLTNKNTTADYIFEAALQGVQGDKKIYSSFPFSVPTYVSGWPNLHVNSIGTGHNNGIIHNGLSDDFSYGSSTYRWDSATFSNNGYTGDDKFPVRIEISFSDYNNVEANDSNAHQGGYL